MPTIPVYLRDRTYWKVCVEAEKLQVGAGKFVSMLVENYIAFLEKKEAENGKKAV
ncbi:MAG: hypothetical protein JRD89_14445 [Deltaproteobacteria bacterium]|nr:hypothetical protein [Deltaproteobacteria bacterium]MBW2674586.1 hypothetical protein [Deltaproteobacteria bacterium]